MVIRQRCLLKACAIFFIFGLSVNAQKAVERVPSADQIEDYEDAILKEIFQGKSSSNSNPAPTPPPIPVGHATNSGISGRSQTVEVPQVQNVAPKRPDVPDYTDWSSSGQTSNQQGGGGSWTSGNSNSKGYNNGYNSNNWQSTGIDNYRNQGFYHTGPSAPQQTGFEPFVNLIGQGAQTFYSGARQLGQNLGINPQYESPFVNYAAGLFGR